MGTRTISPGGALLRKSRIFSIPKPLPEPQSTNLHIGDHKSETMTRQYPQYQSITSPISSREKGDWGFKRPFPLKSTMITSTPVIRVKQMDAIENVTDFASAADHSLSLEKFQEMHVALSIPKNSERRDSTSKTALWFKSVFEEDMDFTDFQRRCANDGRWKFQGPWLARMTEGEFGTYLDRKVRPKRALFRALLKDKLAQEITTKQNKLALEQGKPLPPKMEAHNISQEEFLDYLRILRNDRVTLYTLVSKFLDLAPLGQPLGFVRTVLWHQANAASESPYGKAGPPPCHPSAGISYLRTNAFMENHAVYGPQAKQTPVLARVVYPRAGPAPAKLGVGGFVADTPPGDNEFNIRYGRGRTTQTRAMLNGISHLDTTTFGGAKAYVEPHTASIDPSGRVILKLRETSPEAQLVAKESKGFASIYRAESKEHAIPTPTTEGTEDSAVSSRMDRVTSAILEGVPNRQRGVRT